MYKFSVPYPRDLENMTFDYKVNNSDIGTSLSVYYYHRIVDYKYYDGLCLKNFQYLRGMFEPTFTDGIWADYETGQLIGDVDQNGELNVKDATCIQKCLVGSEVWSDEGEVLPSGFVRFLADFNFDTERNVKDATLIQKYVAA